MNLLDLPEEIIYLISSYLAFKDMKHFSISNKKLFRIIKNNQIRYATNFYSSVRFIFRRLQNCDDLPQSYIDKLLKTLLK